MPPKKQPKWIPEMLAWIDTHTGKKNTAAIEKVTGLVSANYGAWAESIPPKQTDGEAGKKRKDPVASSIGSALKKMAKSTDEEREERLEAIHSQLMEAVRSGESSGELCGAMLGSLRNGMLVESDKAGRAQEIYDGIRSELPKLKVPESHPVARSVHDLYELAAN